MKHYMKVTSSLLVALSFAERVNISGQVELVKKSDRGNEITIPGTYDEAVADLAARGIAVPTFIEFLMEKAGAIARAGVREEILSKFESSISS